MEAPASLSPSSNRSQPLTCEGSEGHVSPSVIKAQEDTARKFAALLSSDTKAVKGSQSQALSSLLADSVAEDSVILTLPSLDLRYAESDGASPLPKIGEKNILGQGPNAMSRTSSRANMTASVLTGAGVDGGPLNVINSNSGDERAVAAVAASHSKSTSWTKSTLVYASHALATNLTEFFSNLIDSRVKAWTLLLLRHSLSTGDTESRSRLLGMLSTSISVQQAETNFKTLTMPNSAAGQRKEADVILPLLFEVSLQMSIQDKPSTIKLLAPGTISGTVLYVIAS
jgi:hypothetical protein